MAASYPRGANPYGGSFAAQGALFLQALRGGYNGGTQIYAPVAKGAMQTFLAPIGESHCINFYLADGQDGPQAVLNGFASLVESWLIKYNARSVMDGAPVNDQIIPSSDVTLVNGVYQVHLSTGIASGGGSQRMPGVRLALQ